MVRIGGCQPTGVLDTRKVRDWAKAEGIDIRERGRVPAEVIEKHKADGPRPNIAPRPSPRDSLVVISGDAYHGPGHSRRDRQRLPSAAIANCRSVTRITAYVSPCYGVGQYKASYTWPSRFRVSSLADVLTASLVF